MLTAVISDLHLGARHRNDVLRSHDVRSYLMPLLSPVDQLVLLGDTLELRQSPLDEVLDIARPFFGELGEIIGGARVVIVAGNHDHALLTEPVQGQFERRVRPGDEGPVGRIASWMPQSEVLVSYPGYRIRDDVYATHGHYLDAHNSVPTIETMLVSVSKRRRRFPSEGPLSVKDYERAMAPLYAIAFRGAQRATKTLPVAPGAPSKRLWELLVRDDGKTTMAGRLLGGVVLPGGVAALNRLGFGPFDPEVSGPVLRRAGLRAISESLDRMGIEARHAIFGHTHRAGPLDRDEGWVTPGGIQLHNTGNWVYEPGFLGRSPTDSPYWPGGLTFVEDEGPPRLERPLSHLRHEDFLPMLDVSARALWPDQRDAEPAPPQ
ncbi:MAG TPA: metallophosphoesterase [Thermoleophilaceae bacterium]|nr:metallophosphoesterase [Thermoleophilaceae bacterium]